MRTTVMVAGVVERSETRTRAALLVYVDVEHEPLDERQLSFAFAAVRAVAKPPVRVLDVAPVLALPRAA